MTTVVCEFLFGVKVSRYVHYSLRRCTSQLGCRSNRRLVARILLLPTAEAPLPLLGVASCPGGVDVVVS